MGWLQHRGKFYPFSSSKITWEQSRDYCITLRGWVTQSLWMTNLSRLITLNAWGRQIGHCLWSDKNIEAYECLLDMAQMSLLKDSCHCFFPFNFNCSIVTNMNVSLFLITNSKIIANITHMVPQPSDEIL